LIESADPLTFGVIRLRFDDGYQADLDLRSVMNGAIWTNIRTDEDFFAIELNDIGSRLSWPRGAGLIELPADGLRMECERQKGSAR
jgi:hypothetical protein